MQLQIDKKKRTSTSGSRSKSKKSGLQIKPDQTVELKPKPLHIFHNQDICAKIKTENSLSVNKSKNNKKNSKSLKRPDKQLVIIKRGSIKESKDQSYLVSAERKYSVNKTNKTEATHMQSQDIFKKLYLIKKQLSKVESPQDVSIAEIQKYFNQIKETIVSISLEPLESIFLKLHSMYITPIESFLNMIKPYESILRKKEQITQMIKEQIEENQVLYQQLDSQDIEIIKLKQKIKKNAEAIEEMKKKKKLEQNPFSMKKKKNAHALTHPAKLVDSSNHSEGDESGNREDFQKKLGREYQKTPVFQEERKITTFKTHDLQNKQNFLQGLTHQPQPSSIKKKSPPKNISKVQHFQQINDSENPPNQQESTQIIDKKQEKIDEDEYLQPPSKMGTKSAGMSFSFKLDIPKIDRSNVGFHDEFYSKLDQFSESWRNQALKEKRF